MPVEPDLPAETMPGALVITVWRPGGRGAPVRARFVGHVLLADDEDPEPSYVDGIEPILARTREWVDAYVRRTV